ncbi:hypothetical protein [Gordonia insulae]|uniref:Uncharacterized protein n=1 Tax=Gordonia insulae TaxID=2420509 RepID=A0A3G8JGZ5_9ACTN|nr:hypothetical protein [Gordonia insulae]AZG44357.1 hypothetical protein D7316_00941 [Gordonia insulae]
MTSTDLIASGPPAWPGCALGAWAAAWLGGRCAPDDVTDTLTEFAARHDVVDPGDVLGGSGADARLGLLSLMRRAGRIEVRLPTAGDPQGLPPDAATRAALEAGETLLIHGEQGNDLPLALIPTLVGDTCRWTVHRYSTSVPVGRPDPLGQVEYDLRETIRETATLIGELGSGGIRLSGTDLRSALAALTVRHQVTLPPHDDVRATRVIDSAAQVEAIVTLAGAQTPTFGMTARHVATGDARLRQLAALARAARATAVNQVIREYAAPER